MAAGVSTWGLHGFADFYAANFVSRQRQTSRGGWVGLLHSVSIVWRNGTFSCIKPGFSWGQSWFFGFWEGGGLISGRRHVVFQCCFSCTDKRVWVCNDVCHWGLLEEIMQWWIFPHLSCPGLHKPPSVHGGSCVCMNPQCVCVCVCAGSHQVFRSLTSHASFSC